MDLERAEICALARAKAVEIVSLLAKELQLIGSEVELRVIEPHVNELPDELSHAALVTLASQEAGLSSDMILMLVDHREFRAIPKAAIAGKVVVDTRGLWAQSNQRAEGEIISRPRAAIV